MEPDVKTAFDNQAQALEAHGKALETIGGNVEEIKESIHGQAMAIREVDHKRQLCRAEMNTQVKSAEGKAEDAAGAAKRADDKAELAHKRVSGLSKAAWGLVIAIVLQLLALVLWMIKTGLAAALEGGG